MRNASLWNDIRLPLTPRTFQLNHPSCWSRNARQCINMIYRVNGTSSTYVVNYTLSEEMRSLPRPPFMKCQEFRAALASTATTLPMLLLLLRHPMLPPCPSPFFRCFRCFLLYYVTCKLWTAGTMRMIILCCNSFGYSETFLKNLHGHLHERIRYRADFSFRIRRMFLCWFTVPLSSTAPHSQKTNADENTQAFIYV